MPESLLNWERLKPYDRNQHRSFEELCYLIATTLYGDSGRFTSIDDSGGGDGVEFYLTWPNGDQWGWQAKFYYPDGRLSRSRETSIRDSLQKACRQHPQLRKWFLCTPKNLTPNEQEWFDRQLAGPQVMGEPVMPPGHRVKLDKWSESDFIAWMGQERFAGCRLYFFGELELSLAWFSHQFERQVSLVRDRYDPSLHTETGVDARIHQMLGDATFVHRFREFLADVKQGVDEFKRRVTTVQGAEPQVLAWGDSKQATLEAAERLQEALATTLAALVQAGEHLGQQRLDLVRAHEWDGLLAEMERAHEAYWESLQAIDISELRYTSGSGGTDAGGDSEERARRRAEEVLRGPARSAANVMDKARDLISRLQTLQQSDLHVFGDAGFGKTHLACHICHERLQAGLPALLVLGVHFTRDGPLEEQLRAILDIPPAYSWHDFLRALSVAAQAHCTRIPLVIDGLHEATRDGVLSRVWELGLPGLVADVATTKDVVLVTTCRTSYRNAIWLNGGPANTEYAGGFDWTEVREAVRRYFQAYRIEADLTAAPLEQFSHPIYLKIFCETENPERRQVRHIYVGEQTLFKVFDDYLAQCNRALCERLGLRRGAQVLASILDRMAAHLWSSRTRRIPISQAAQLIDGMSLDQLRWETSRTQALESEGLLVCRDWGDSEEELFFTYDLLGGYLIARHLIDVHSGELESLLNAPETVSLLFSEDRQVLHPLHDDIRRGLAALLPVRTGQYLHNLMDNPIAFTASIDALFEIAPQAVNEAAADWVAHLFTIEQNRMPLLERTATTVGHVNHPLNVAFWHEQLRGLSIPERDTSWTEYVRQHEDDFTDRVEQFESRCRGESPVSSSDEARMHLLARHIMWLLTSTVRPLRNRATRALYWYGRRFPRPFFRLVLDSFEINDPYVSERILAAAYGVAMARQHDFADLSFAQDELPQWGRALYVAMFALGAPSSTTHILARDYARRTVQIALLHYPEVLSPGEIERITPPYTDGGLREWGESDDRDDGQYRDGDAPIHMDFENYTLGSLVDNRRNYDYEHTEYRRVRANIYWRIYDLGYSLDRFGTIDRSIAAMNPYGHRHEDGSKTDRYGKKYSWIAFFELAGYLRDQGLPKHGTDDPRISQADLDPSFPDAVPVHRLVTTDFLGASDVSTREWIRDGGVPDVAPLLIVDELMGEAGPWVLLDGYVNQEDEARDRHRFTFIRGLIVPAADAEEIAERLEQQDLGNRWLPEKPESHYTYAGEIPWCDTWPDGGWDELTFVIGTATATAPEERLVLQRAGEAIPEDEQEAFLNQIRDVIIARDEQALAEALREQGMEAAVVADERLETRKETRTFYMLIPVQDCHWSGTRSVVDLDHSAEVPVRHLADSLALVGQPQTFDMFGHDGRRASRVLRYEDNSEHREYFTYLRQDLLDEYLARHGFRLIWATWGEREYAMSRMIALAPAYRGEGEQPWQVFQQIETYDALRRCRNVGKALNTSNQAVEEQ